MNQQNREITEFFVDNTQNRNNDQLLSNVPDTTTNREIAEFFVDNTQNQNDEQLLLNVSESNIQQNIIENFHADQEGDVDVNQGYENYLNSLAANLSPELMRNINNDHNYSNNRVSQSKKMKIVVIVM